MSHKYRIRCWIPDEPAEDEEIYHSLKEAMSAIEHFAFLQPENIYRIERVEDEENNSDGLETKL